MSSSVTFAGIIFGPANAFVLFCSLLSFSLQDSYDDCNKEN